VGGFETWKTSVHWRERSRYIKSSPLISRKSGLTYGASKIKIIPAS